MIFPHFNFFKYTVGISTVMVQSIPLNIFVKILGLHLVITECLKSPNYNKFCDDSGSQSDNENGEGEVRILVGTSEI